MNDIANPFLRSNDVREYLWQNTTLQTTLSPKQFTCYDDYYCNSDSLANTGHIVVGVLGLILSLIGLALNVLLIPVLSLVGIRSSATYYMIGMAISDCCLLIVNLMLVVIRYLPSPNQDDQLYIYQNFVAYLVPFGFPLKMLCQTLTMSLCTCLILDRFVYSRTETKLNTAKRAIAVKVITIVVVMILLFKLPNFLIFKIVENLDSLIAVRWTLLAKSWIFIVDMTIFVVIYGILFSFTLILWHVVVKCHFMPKVFLVKLFDVVPTERFQRRERLYIMVGLMIGVSTVILKIPQFIRNAYFGFSIARNEGQMHKLSVADMWMECGDLVLIIIKPCIYLLFVLHFRQALKDMIGLLFNRSSYTVLQASGGMGKEINLTGTESGLKRNDTSNSLLQYNSDKRFSQSFNKVDIEALAIERATGSIKIGNHIESNSSRLSMGSSNSMLSSNNDMGVK